MPENNESEFDRLVRAGKIDEAKAKGQIIDMWNKGGGDQPVKVMPIEPTDRQSIKGYITQEKFIKGHTPQEMEKILGLESGKLSDGATIYKLNETPSADQFKPRGYSQTPGGNTYEPGGKYPPGEGVPQWELTEDVPADVVGKVDADEPWMGNSEAEKENPELQPQNDETASKSVDHDAHLSENSSTTNSESEQSDEYYQGYGY